MNKQLMSDRGEYAPRGAARRGAAPDGAGQALHDGMSDGTWVVVVLLLV